MRVVLLVPRAVAMLYCPFFSFLLRVVSIAELVAVGVWASITRVWAVQCSCSGRCSALLWLAAVRGSSCSSVVCVSYFLVGN